MKIRVPKKYGIIILISLLSCSNKNQDYKNNLYIDPVNIADSLLSILIIENENKFNDFNEILKTKKIEDVKGKKYLEVMFRYRDTILIPLYFQIINDNDIHPYFKLMAINVLGEVASNNEFDDLLRLFKEQKNLLIKEYLANAMGKIADSSDVVSLHNIRKSEKDSYIQKTILAGIDRAKGGRKADVKYLPLIDTTVINRIHTYPSKYNLKEFYLYSRMKLDTNDYHYIPIAKEFIFPHMQYKKCQSIYSKVKQPFESFGLPGVSHVGEDSGWLFEGMPIHSIANGRVALIQHDESWGCLIAVESKLENDEIICTYYGHLSGNLDVYVGKTVKKGDKIGEIGTAYSFQNGGYRAHLHLGIEKASITKAIIAGYHDNVEHWYDPIKFILRNTRI